MMLYLGMNMNGVVWLKVIEEVNEGFFEVFWLKGDGCEMEEKGRDVILWMGRDWLE